MTGEWHKNLAKATAVAGCGLAYLASPGIARADDLGAIGDGAAIFFALAVTVVVFFLLIITTAISAAFGRKESPRSLARRILAFVSLGLMLLLTVGNTALFIKAFKMTANEALETALVALVISAVPLVFGIRAVRYQSHNAQ